MQLTKFLRLYKNLIIMSGLILVSAAGLLFGVIPLTQKTISLWTNGRALSEEITLLGSKSAILQSVDEGTLRSDVLTLATAVPPDKSLPSILSTIDTVSGQSSVAISDVSLIKPGSIATESAKKLTKDEAKIGSNLLPFSVNGKGTFDEIKSFLSSVVSVRRMFRLRSMNLTITGGLTSARIDLDAFYFPYPATVGSVQSVANLTDNELKTVALVESLPLATAQTAPIASESAQNGRSDPFSP